MNEQNELPALYTYADLEAVFGLSHGALYRMFVKPGKLCAVRFGPKTVRFRAEDVRRLVEEWGGVTRGTDGR